MKIINREFFYWAMDREMLVKTLIDRDIQIAKLEMKVERLKQKVFAERTKLAAVASSFDNLIEVNKRGPIYPFELEEKIGVMQVEIKQAIDNWAVKE